MKICVYGAGAIGGLIAARLSAAGAEVSVIARGETLRSLCERGIGLVQEDGTSRFSPVTVTASPAELGVQDLIVIAVKQPALNAILEGLGPLMSEHTRVLLAMNGVPWWFFDGIAGAPADPVLRTVDPLGELRSYVPSRQVIGCVVHLSATAEAPGIIRLNKGNGLIIGEPLGTLSEPTTRVAEMLMSAGFEVEISASIQHSIWFKLLGNMTMNPVSALTRATTASMLDDELVNRFCCDVMAEAAEIGAAFGCVMEQTPKQRNAVTRRLGAFKTSMLQDVEAGRRLEYQALVGVVYEMAQKMGLPAPNLATLYGLIRLLDKNLGE